MGLFSKLFKKKDIELTEDVLKWNKMCELFGDGELEEPFYSLFYYDGEIQNGGHLQFFCNLEESEEPKLKDVLKNLKKLLSEEMYANFSQLSINSSVSTQFSPRNFFDHLTASVPVLSIILSKSYFIICHLYII